VSDVLDDAWPGTLAYVVLRLENGTVRRVRERGDLEEVRPWASISKLTVALAFGVEMDWGFHAFGDIVGPSGANVANLLSHSSGLGLEEGDPVAPVGTKRVYSNYGYDYLTDRLVGKNPAANWLNDRIFQPLGMSSTSLEDRPSSGVVGSTNDLAHLAVAWLRPDIISRETRDRLTRPYLPDLAGILPGFGRFTPCPWGMGPQLRGNNEHWMGDWPPASFGHFGQSGSLLLVNAAEGVGVVATCGVPFGPWAKKLWPAWTSAQRTLAVGS
jgi:CubicO group peptidase (beta-lactamase class C family)